MREAGLAGIEADHAEHRRSRSRRWRTVAGDLGLLVTGGSDHHGRPGDAVGAGFTPRETVEGLRSLRGQG
jgi:predicted metal-dependent phosphoesterase TrpH